MKNPFRFLFLLALLGGRGAAPLAAQPTPAVASFTLVNADTDLDIQALPSGAVLDLATLPTRNLNIRANTDPATVGSVAFSLSGAQAQADVENVVPYALFSDLNGDYFAWTPPVGAYALTATPYAGAAASGAAGAALSITFTVINSVGSVASFTLVNADTDLAIQTLLSGAVLDLAKLPTRHLNIRANTSPATLGSVAFSLSGAQAQANVENVAPYALFSDLNGDYDAWTPPVGTYALAATPYSAPAGGGTAGTPLAIRFVVQDSRAPLPVVLTAFTAEAAGAGAVALGWATASELGSCTFVVERSLDGQQFGAVGTVAGQGTTALPHAYHYADYPALAGPTQLYYRLREVDADGTTRYSPVRPVLLTGPGPALVVFPTVAGGGQVQYALAGPPTGTEVLELLTLLGQRRGQFGVAAGGVGTVSLAGLAPGVYLLRLTSTLGRFTQRFVLP